MPSSKVTHVDATTRAHAILDEYIAVVAKSEDRHEIAQKWGELSLACSAAARTWLKQGPLSGAINV